MINKDQLKSYAAKLMFDMEDEEYETLQAEFAVILKQMELISHIDNIDQVKPMTFPYLTYQATLRDDIIGEIISTEEALANVKKVEKNQVKVPKVVE